MEESLYNAGQIQGNGTSGRERSGGIRLSGQRSGRKVSYKRVARKWWGLASELVSHGESVTVPSEETVGPNRIEPRRRRRKGLVDERGTTKTPSGPREDHERIKKHM